MVVMRSTIFALLLMTANIAALDPRLIDLLPCDVGVAVGFDVDGFKSTPSGNELFSLLAKENARLFYAPQATILESSAY